MLVRCKTIYLIFLVLVTKSTSSLPILVLLAQVLGQDWIDIWGSLFTNNSLWKHKNSLDSFLLLYQLHCCTSCTVVPVKLLFQLNCFTNFIFTAYLQTLYPPTIAGQSRYTVLGPIIYVGVIWFLHPTSRCNLWKENE